jgi:phospholipid transport system substrate-binding protein
MSQGWKTLEWTNPLQAFIMVVFVAMSLPWPALAAGPQARIRDILESASAVIHDPQLQGSQKEGERKQRVQQIIFAAFDFGEMAKAALRPYWEKLTPEQQAEFVSLFGDTFERSYNTMVLRFLPEREVEYGPETITQHHAVVGTTLVVRRTNARLPVDYHLIEKDQRWSVYDVVVDGISLGQNYRAQFDRIIRSSSYEELLRRMKSKKE